MYGRFHQTVVSKISRRDNLFVEEWTKGFPSVCAKVFRYLGFLDRIYRWTGFYSKHLTIGRLTITFDRGEGGTFRKSGNSASATNR
ncbi:MAG: hypothetical protein WCQ55_04375 [Paludibacteraceae bacterium]|nr:hypothetical protein [Prevotellaceae bacterium]